MVAHVPGEVVLQCPDVLLQRVHTRRIFRTDVDNIRAIIIVGDRVLGVFHARGEVVKTCIGDVNRWSLILHVAVVANERSTCTKFVVEIVAEVRVPLHREGVRLIHQAIATVVERETVSTQTPLVGIGVVQLIAKGELVAGIDVPVQASQQGERLLLDVATLIGVANACDFSIAVGNGLCHLVGHEVVGCTSYIAGRIFVLLIFQIGEEEEFVLHDRSANRTTKGLGLLVGQRLTLMIQLAVATVHVLVSVIGVSRSRQFVRTRLGDGIDGTSCETALAHIERRNSNL